MIISKVLKINNGTAPYTYTVLPNSCITVNSLTGVLNENEPKLLTFDVGDNCVSTISISVTDSNGCSNVIQYSLEDVCNTLTLTLSQSNYSFTTTVSGGSGIYKYKWIFDTSKFTAISDTDRLITLTPIGTQSTSTITCIVTDSNNCSVTSQITFQPCQGTLLDTIGETYCTTDYFLTKTIELKYTGCDLPVWEKLIITATEGLTGVNWTYKVLDSSITSIFIQIQIPIKEITAPTLVRFNATVPNSYGVTSNSSDIKVTVSSCAAYQGNVVGIGTIQQISTGTVIGQQLKKAIANYITSTYPLDWNTFTFIASTGQTFNNKEDMTVQAGNLYLTANHEILFEIFNTPTRDVEIVKWKISDIYGTVSNTVQEIYILSALSLPTVTNDNLCGIMNQLFNINGIFTNDSNYVIASLQITQQPLHGNIVIDGTNIYFSPTVNFYGTDVFKYKVANADGIYSAEATVNLTIISSGLSTNINNIIC